MSTDNDQHLKELYYALKYSHETFDKYMVYVSAGALAVFLAVTEKIVPFQTAEFKIFLVLSFYLCSLTTVLAVIAHYISARNIRKCIEVYDTNDFSAFDGLSKSLNKKIHFINVTSIVTLCAGLGLFVVYLQLNLS